LHKTGAKVGKSIHSEEFPCWAFLTITNFMRTSLF
jgi:hypothetical protein